MEHLPSKLNWNSQHSLGDLCLIVDMQNVYLPGQPWACHTAKEACTSIKRLLDHHSCDNYIFTRYIAPKNPVGTWKNYNHAYQEINSSPWMNELMDELKPYTELYPVYDKSTYSSFHQPDTAMICSMADRIIITGVVAECCVLSTILHGIDLGLPIIYLKDAVSGLSSESEHMTETIVSNFSPIHTQIMTVDEYLESRK